MLNEQQVAKLRARTLGTILGWRRRWALARYVTAWGMVRRMPESLAAALGALGGQVHYLVDLQRRNILRENLRTVLGPECPPDVVERAVRAGFVTYARYWVEAFRLGDLDAGAITERLQVVGREYLDAAFSQGRGVIVVTPHLGNWDAGGAWLAAAGYRPTAVVERLQPPALFARFVAHREQLGLGLVPLDDGRAVIRSLLEVLRGGGTACLVADRLVKGERGVPVHFFGKLTEVPGGPAMLSWASGAPILPVAVYQEAQTGRWQAWCRPLVQAERSHGAPHQREQIAVLTQRLADEFAWLIERAPQQWHVLSPIWAVHDR